MEGFQRGRPDLQLILEAESMDTLEDATDEAIGVFRAIRKIPPGEPNNFYIATNDQLMDTFGSFTSSIKIFVVLMNFSFRSSCFRYVSSRSCQRFLSIPALILALSKTGLNGFNK